MKNSQMLCLDIGGYQLTPWLNKSVKAEAFYLPPKNTQEFFTVKRNSKSHLYKLCNFHMNIPILNFYGLDYSSLDDSISRVNQVISPFTRQHLKNEGFLWLFTIMGFILTAVFGTLLGLYVSYFLAVAFTLAYVVSFLVVLYFVRKQNKMLLLKLHFNLSLALRNEND